MEGVVTNGTASKVFIGAPYLAAGKTGTAQVYSLQGANYKGHAIAEHLRDHALFIAFAPAEQPKIALALIVENGGWGAESAGPIARKVLDYYLVDTNQAGRARRRPSRRRHRRRKMRGMPVIGGPQPPAAVGAAGIAWRTSRRRSRRAAASNPAVAKAASRGRRAAAAPAAAAARRPRVPPRGAARGGSAPAAASAPALHAPPRASAGAPRKPRAPNGPARGIDAAPIPRNDSRDTVANLDAVTGGIDE